MVYNQLWYENPNVLKAVNACLNVLEASGISAECATLVPDCLAEAIKCSNYETLKQGAFKSAPISVTANNDGEYSIMPESLQCIDLLWPK